MYSVTINLSAVRNTEDLMLQLVYVLRGLDKQQTPIEKSTDRCLVPLVRKGCLRYGTLAVSRSNGR